MRRITKQPQLAYKIAALLVLAAFLLSSCQNPGGAGPTPGADQPIPTPTAIPMAEVVFKVTLPSAIPEGATLSLAVLDEVTGIPINPLYYPMKAIDALHYSANIAAPLDGVVKYRYVLQTGSFPITEDTAFDLPIRYRMLYIPGTSEVNDIVSSWTAQPFSGETGRIQGQVVDIGTGAPLTNILVTAGGVQTLTDSLGNYILEGLPPGTHNLMTYALDGTYETFQQGANVAASTPTPAAIGLNPAQMVNLTFLVTVPTDTIVGVPIRLAGNLLQLGNSFADLDGGMSSVATRMPVLLPVLDGRYSITLRLPAGMDLRYKYTLGDGLWNAEHFQNGSLRVRQLIVPRQDAIIQDAVETWQSGPSSPIMFEVSVPNTTPPTDTVSIQFNPFGWTEPVPMWAVGDNRWVYRLTSPMDMLGTFGYRFCRNGQCGSADDIDTAGYASAGRQVSTSLEPQNTKDTVREWQWAPVSQPVTTLPVVSARAAGFSLGVEFQPTFDPTWTPLYVQAMQKAASYRSNLVILAPTWTVSRNNPLVFAPQPGGDPLWGDTLQAVEQARKLNMGVALLPTPRFPNLGDDWRSVAPSDWNVWFENYRRFAIYHADLATASGAQALILGGERIPPALYDGSADAEDRFRSMLGEIRQHYSGMVLWAFYYPGMMQAPPSFLDSVDGIYLLWNAPLSYNPSPAVEEMTYEAGALLDADILPFAVSIQKPIILAAAYPAVTGAASGCVPGPAGGCIDWMTFSRPNPDLPIAELNLQEHANIYQALLTAINDRPWLSGFVSRGFYPAASLADKSASVNGKPAGDVLGTWYPQLLGIAP